MRNSFARAAGTTGFALAALGSVIIMTSGCGDQASNPLASEGGLSDADAILATSRDLIEANGLDPEEVREVVITDMLGEQHVAPGPA